MDGTPAGTPAPRPPGPLAQARAAPVTYLLAATNVAVFLWVAAHGSTTDTETLLRFGALERSRVWEGEWWRLLTAEFLHAGPMHLGMNVLFGVPWCVPVERMLGRSRFLGLYLVSALGASAASLLGDHVSAGASGALFGVIGATLVLHRRVVGSWGAFFRSPGARSTLVSLAVFSLAGFWLRFDELAHAGGFVTGAAMTWLWTRPAPRRTVVGWALFGAALAGLVAVVVRPDPAWQAGWNAMRTVDAALERGDVPAARAAIEAARAAGAQAVGLDYQEGLVLARENRLEEAARTLRPLTTGAPGPLRDSSRRAFVVIAKALGARRYTGSGVPRDPKAAQAWFEEACGLGDAEACRAAEELRAGGGAGDGGSP